MMESKSVQFNAVQCGETSYVTDCLTHFNEILNLVLSSVKACDEFSAIVKARMNAESTFAKNMASAAALRLQYEGKGKLQTAFDQMKADMHHNATQHTILAENLKRDVYNPLIKLKTRLQDQYSDFKGHSVAARQLIEKLHRSWTHSQQEYHYAYLEACRHFAKCLELGLPPPRLTADMFEATPEGAITIKNLTASQERPLEKLTSAGENDVIRMLNAASEASGRAAESVFAAAIGGQLRTAESPEKITAKAVAANALLYLQQAELKRFDCEVHWDKLVHMSHRLALKSQVMLNKCQASQELFIQFMGDHIKKVVVFESSAIANMQYDIQMLFKVVEDVKFDEDMLSWMQGPSFLSEPESNAYISCWDVVTPSLHCWPSRPCTTSCFPIRNETRSQDLPQLGSTQYDSSGFMLVQLKVDDFEIYCDETFGDVLCPPSTYILTADDLHASLKKSHYIIDGGVISPPSLNFVQVAQILLCPRLVSTKCDGKIFGKSELTLQRLEFLSHRLSEQWSDDLDPYEKVISWFDRFNKKNRDERYISNYDGGSKMAISDVVVNRIDVVVDENRAPREALAISAAMHSDIGQFRMFGDLGQENADDDAY